MFEPEIDESLFPERTVSDRTYFAGANAKDFDKMMGQLNVDEDEDDENENDNADLTTFQKKAKKMTNVLDDGSIKKKVKRLTFHDRIF